MSLSIREQLLAIIQKKGPQRPHDLARALHITPQALHRHLKRLTVEGLLETRGRAPTTRYALAGVPDFAQAAAWLKARHLTQNPSEVSETRDTFTARLSGLKALLKQGLPAQDLPLLFAIAGEIGNNCFDHNLGQWQDVPGCWFEAQITGGVVWLCIADRGQGVLATLKRVAPHAADSNSALQVAFTEHVSGRAPEQRGNGLKFVRQTVLADPRVGLACASGPGKIHFGEEAERCARILDAQFPQNIGTITLLAMKLERSPS